MKLNIAIISLITLLMSNFIFAQNTLGLTENKIQLGLGNFGHGYRHHSSLFYLNSIIFLPYIKFYLFHSIGFLINPCAPYSLDILLFRVLYKWSIDEFCL